MRLKQSKLFTENIANITVDETKPLIPCCIQLSEGEGEGEGESDGEGICEGEGEGEGVSGADFGA